MNKTVTSKEDILSVSRELAAEKGIQEINMRSVAARCGVAVGSVYNYFSSKNDLMIAVIATGRAGSAFAAEIATMKATEEINAMQTMGFSPWRFLVIPKLLAMICMMPLLTFFGDMFGIAGGMIVGTFELDIPVHTYYTQTVYWVPPRFFVESLTKSIVFAIIVTGICCLRGFEAEEDSLGIGRATTSSVVTSIIVIIVADTLMARMFNMIFYGSAV